MCASLTELQEKKKKSGEGGGEDGGKGGKGKGKEDEDAEDALDWWSRYYETLKDRERNEKRGEQLMSRPSKKKEKTTEESEEEKLKKKIPRLTVRQLSGVTNKYHLLAHMIITLSSRQVLRKKKKSTNFFTDRCPKSVYYMAKYIDTDIELFFYYII